ncbi:MAG: DUF2344 domain-containing protein [Clostridia bacterium]|nr:DUF2344 domain-containing protein [Clostridia bacterium]
MVPIIADDAILYPAATLRVRFRKTGALQYISHLDLVRTFEKVLVRAGLPLWYSEGFNPHPRFSFSTPMSIGLESLYELMDVKIEKKVNCEAVKEALNRNLTAECVVEEVYYPDTKFTDISLASYEIVLQTAGADEALAEKCGAALRGSPVTVLKRTKSGEKETDISPMIIKSEASFAEGKILLAVTLTVDNEKFLNPEYIVTYLKETLGVLSGSPLEEAYSILRTGLYGKSGELFR